MATTEVEEFLGALGVLIAEYQPDDRGVDPGRDTSVGYGNIRFQYWPNGERVNVGLIYETPGGSTNQINIDYRPETRDFSVPHISEPTEVTSADQAEILALIKAHIESIPGKRVERLRAYIDSWVEQCLDRAAIFARLNQLIFQDLKGGRITHSELAQGCHYAVERLSEAG